MAQVANPRKVFNFNFAINGIIPFQVQELEFPEIEIEATAHGDTNHDIKTAGRIKTGDLVLKKLRPSTPDAVAWLALNLSQNPLTGGSLPQTVKFTAQVFELGVDGITVVNTWTYEGCWVKKIKQSSANRMSSDNIIEEITISVDYGVRV